MRNYLLPEEEEAVKDRFEGWELIEFLQIPIEKILEAAADNDWIDDTNVGDLRDFLELRR